MTQPTNAKEQIGFIGLGLMGHGIAKNIVEKGYPLTFLGRQDRAKAADMTASRRARGDDAGGGCGGRLRSSFSA